MTPERRPASGGLGESFWARRPLIGMVHLAALPGSFGEASPGLEMVLEQALKDARTLEEGGADAVMVENFFDSPFPKEQSPPVTVAAMAVILREIRRAVALPMGVNVLRNDYRAALSIAHICGAQFVRINVYVGAAVTDQGIIEGAAREAVRLRRELSADVAIWADVFVKHAAPLGSVSIADAARDAVERGRADAVIVTGAATGLPVDPAEVRAVRAAVPHTALLLGSGVSAEHPSPALSDVDGAIVGTGLKQDGHVAAPVDLTRVRAVKALLG